VGSKDNKNTWSTEGFGGGTSIEEAEELEDDLDLDFFAFLLFFALPCFLALFLEECFIAAAATVITGTDPKVPPKGLGVPKAPSGIVIKGTNGLVGS
jgi:hypothetical protein